MSITPLTYPLSHAFIHHWLVAGPLETLVPDLSQYPASELEASIYRQQAQPNLEVTLPPVDLGPLGPLSEEKPTIRWRYYRCQQDHLIDFSAFFPLSSFLRSWAYAGLTVAESRPVTLLLAAYGPTEVWLNGQLLHRQDSFQKSALHITPVQCTLQSGNNDLLLRFDAVALRDTPYAVAVQVQGIAETEVEIVLPTEIEPKMLERRQNLERVIEKAYLDCYVFGHLTGDSYDKNEPIRVRFASDLEVGGEITHRLQSLGGDIFQAGIKRIGPGADFELARSFPLRNGPHHLALLPIEAEYYLKKIQFDRKDLFWVVRTPFSLQPYGMINDRVREALEDVASRRNESLYCEIAKIALGRWEKFDRKILNAALERVRQRQADSVYDLLGILAIMLRFWKRRYFLDDMRSTIEAAIKGYRYWTDTPEGEVMDFTSQSCQLLFHTCELLAGQLLPEGMFVDSGKSGRQHREQGEARLIAWLRQCGQYGLWEWDSPAVIEATLSALSHLVDLAKSEAVREMASVLMDKIFFSLAVDTWQGMYGASHGVCDTASALSHRLEPTSGITRLMWGLGNFNESVMGAVSLACCRRYELPAAIRKIALDAPAALWSRQRSGLPASPGASSESLDWEANRVIYKTEHFMLASAQDYHPGEPGSAEHLWQATLGPDAVVFTNHPGNMSELDAHRPNLWVGNRSLPRLAQWGDVLVALYRLPQNDWLGFTHAYFPASAFDETSFQGNWAFARKGEAYLALFAANGLEWITSGKTAYRELRSHGPQNLWLCHMGQALLDGSFTEFQEKIQAMELVVDGLQVRLTSLRDETLSFGWDAPLVVNGQEQDLSGFKQFENQYCVAELPARQIDIVYGEEGIRLTFE